MAEEAEGNLVGGQLGGSLETWSLTCAQALRVNSDEAERPKTLSEAEESDESTAGEEAADEDAADEDAADETLRREHCRREHCRR